MEKKFALSDNTENYITELTELYRDFNLQLTDYINSFETETFIKLSSSYNDSKKSIINYQIFSQKAIKYIDNSDNSLFKLSQELIMAYQANDEKKINRVNICIEKFIEIKKSIYEFLEKCDTEIQTHKDKSSPLSIYKFAKDLFYKIQISFTQI